MFNYDYEATDQGDAQCVPFSFGCTETLAHNYDRSANSGHCRFGDSCTGVEVTAAVVDSDAYPNLQFSYPNIDAWCICADGFSGNYCDVNIDGCADSPCQNGGACHDSTPGYFCDCSQTDYRGATCEMPAEACLDQVSPCGSGSATCKKVPGESTIDCVCPFGQAYDANVEDCAVVDECASSPCLNGGTCVDQIGTYRCWCVDGFWGMRCGLSTAGCGQESCAAKIAGCLDPTMYTYDASANDHTEDLCEEVVYGCTDRSMFNWDENANTLDGTCVPFAFGCTDPEAINYDRNANCASEIDPPNNCDNTASVCEARVYGCTDQTMSNFDPTANVDDGSCQSFMYGCMDTRATNFDQSANEDDGSCVIRGCTYTMAVNYEEYANENDGSCEVNGCTNVRANNYLEIATNDDGSCIVNGCTDYLAVNYNYHATLANPDAAECEGMRLGCIDDPTASNYNSLANVHDGFCVGACINDYQWLDSDGQGCASYYLGYCGFEDSITRCPSVCGKCDTDVRPGCDSIAGSVLQLDTCGVCDGSGTDCNFQHATQAERCQAAATQVCERNLIINSELRFENTAACQQRIAQLGGRIILREILLAATDCGQTIAAWQVNGYSGLRDCVTAQTDCIPQNAQTRLDHTCKQTVQTLDASTWQEMCPGVSRTGIVCDSATSGYSVYDASMPDSAGTFTANVAQALANGMFSDGVTMGDCAATCVHDMVQTTTAAWSWHSVGKCWMVADSSHDCLNTDIVALANMAADGLCPTRVQDVLKPIAFLSAPSNIKQYSTAAQEPNPTALEEIAAPSSLIGGEWLRNPETFDAAGVVDVATVDVVSGVSHYAWQIEDSASSASAAQDRPAGGKAAYYKAITTKERETALSCGWSVHASLRIVSCAQASVMILVNFDNARVWRFWLCVNGDLNVVVETFGHDDIVLTSDGEGTVNYHSYMFTYNPASADGVIISFDDVEINAASPIASQGFSSSDQTANTVQWGTGSTSGRAAANFELIEWQLLDLPCLTSFSTYEGCMDARYTNFDSNAAMQNGPDSCVDSDPPIIEIGETSVDVVQFSTYEFATATAIDDVDGDVSSQVQREGSVDTNVAGLYAVTYTVTDAAGNAQRVSLTVTVTEFDECASNPCRLESGNALSCSQSDSQSYTPKAEQRFVCSCAAGWRGDTCSNDVDECETDPCLNGGACVDSSDDQEVEIGEFECVCDAGFTGTTCEVDVNECASDPCDPNGSCTDEINAYSCNCNDGWQGVNCADDIDDCLPNPCNNDATCTDTGTVSFSCACASGWTGSVCDEQIDPCAREEDDCHSNADCQHTGPGEYSCTCQRGYDGDGQTCGDVDECTSSPCQNSGACLDSTVQSVATCTENVMNGDPVDAAACLDVTGNDLSESTACLSITTSSDGDAPETRACTYIAAVAVDDYMCVCADGWGGDDCELDFDECSSAPCQNGATCHESSTSATVFAGAFECVCAVGWTSTAAARFDGICDEDIDECSTDPCSNGGTCTDSTDDNAIPEGDFSCDCATTGFDGNECESNINDCQVTSCGQDADPRRGSCVDGINAFTCSCASGWSGENCDEEIQRCQTEEHDCDINSLCENTGPGAHVCTCNDGWQDIGDGVCLDIDECRISECRWDDFECHSPCQNGAVCTESSCDSGSECSNPEVALATFHCACNPGYAGPQCETDVDECVSQPCRNSAACTDSTSASVPINEFHCECQAGFSGDTCHTDVDECNPSPCEPGNTAACLESQSDFPDLASYLHVTTNFYLCVCEAGWEGVNCNVDVDECASNPCKNPVTDGPICYQAENGGNGYTCECGSGYTGMNCLTDINECANSPCENGRCIEYVGAYSCACVQGYDGENCANNIDDCAPESCAHAGTCVDGIESYTCECVTGWTGSNCETDINECRVEECRYDTGNCPSPCQNGATCSDLVGLFTCTCAAGFSGDHCGVDVDECESLPCDNGGACTQAIDSYSCNCNDGWNGGNCEVDVNECASDPCDPNGSCTDEINAYSCNCNDGWQGVNCADDIDDCLPNPCNNDATCTDTGTVSFSCACASGWTGSVCDEQIDPCAREEDDCHSNADCQHTGPGEYSCTCQRGYDGDGQTCGDVDECTSSPCQNSGACLDSTIATIAVDDYTCVCADGWGGEECEVDIDECSSAPCQNGATCYESSIVPAYTISSSSVANFAGPFEGCKMYREQEWLCQTDLNRPECAALCTQNEGCISFNYRESDGRCCLGRDNFATLPSARCCGGNCQDYEFFEANQLDAYGCKCSANFFGASCETEIILGCTDPDAFNYMSTATVDNGGCESVVVGCMWEEAYNYNPAANTMPTGEDDGCVAVVLGCTSEYAVNRNPNANTDDGTCIIDRCEELAEVACGANTLCVPNIGADSYECMCLPNYKNIGGDEMRCVPEIKGCTDGPTCTSIDIANAASCAEVEVRGVHFDTARQRCEYMSCSFHPGAHNFDLSADTEEDPSTCYYNPCATGTHGCPDSATCVFTGPGSSECECPVGFFWDGFNCEPNPILGCTDAEALNFDTAADLDDGSCVAKVLGCMDASSWNYNATANADDGSCIRRVYGCIDETALNYNPTANTQFGVCMARIYGCTNPVATNFLLSANSDDGSCEIDPCTTADDDCPPGSECKYEGQGQHSCVCPRGFIGDPRGPQGCAVVRLGCTDPNAINHATFANEDDGTCVYFCDDSQGCCQDPEQCGSDAFNRCDPGWTGPSCTVNIDYCTSMPCENSGECVDDDDEHTYSCSCTSGFEGDNCAEDIDECADAPCLNAGACTQGMGASVERFVCSCVTGYSGRTCATCESGEQSAETAIAVEAHLAPSLRTVDFAIDGHTRDLVDGPALSTCVALLQRIIRHGISLSPEVALGSQALCEHQESANTLRISVGVDGHIYPNDEFVLQPCTIWTIYQETLSGPIEHALWGTLTIRAPTDPVHPSAVIIGPDQLSHGSDRRPCVDFIELDGSTSSGGASSTSSLTTQWSWDTPDGAVFPGMEQILLNATGSLRLVLPTSEWPNLHVNYLDRGQDLTFYLTIFDPVLQLEDTTSHSVRRIAKDVPLVSIQGPSPMEVRCSQPVLLHATANLPTCRSEGRLELVWYINSDRQQDETTTTLYISRGKLARGLSNVVQVQAHHRTSNNVVTTSIDSVVLTCKPEPMIASITGGTRRLVGYDEVFSLDASTSYDPAAAEDATLSFAWTCKKDDGRDCFDTSELGFSEIWEIDAQELSDTDSTYEFSVIVSNEGRSASATVFITKVGWVPPSVGITVRDQLHTKVNNDEKLTLQGDITTRGLEYTSYWSWPDSDDCAYLVLGDDSLLTERSATNLVLQPYVLQPGNVYCFKLTATTGMVQGYSQLTIEVNEPPSAGVAVVEPTAGTALVTVFTIRATDFYDEDRPLSYRFGYGSHDTIRYLSDFQRLSQVGSLLPPGDVSSAGSYPAFVEAEDMYGSRSSAVGSVSVSPIQAGTGTIESLATRLLDGASAQGDVQKSAQIVQSIADTLNHAGTRRRLAESAETCEVDSCTGYIPGTAESPSTSCPPTCSLTRTDAGETCTAIVFDCTTGYIPGDAVEPSTTCPSGCVFTEAEDNIEDFTSTRRLLVENLRSLTETQTVTSDIAERLAQTLASITTVSIELDATSVMTTVSVCEDLSHGDYSMNDATAGSILSSMHSAIAASAVLYASDQDTLRATLLRCEAALHKTGAAVGSQRVAGEVAFEQDHRLFAIAIQVYPRTATSTFSLPARLLDSADSAENIVDSDGAHSSLIEWKSDSFPQQTNPEQGTLFGSSVFSLNIGDRALVGRRSSDRVRLDMQIFASSQNVTLGCGSWNASTGIWQIEASTSSERLSSEVLRCSFASIGSYVALPVQDSTTVSLNVAKNDEGLVDDSTEAETFSAFQCALLLLLCAVAAAILVVFSIHLRAIGTLALRPRSCVARRRADSLAKASVPFALCCTVNVSCAYRSVHLTALAFEITLIICGSVLIPPIIAATASWWAGAIVAVIEFALADLTVTPIRQMLVGGGWSATVAKIHPDYKDDGYDKPVADATGALKIALRARWCVSLACLLSLFAVCVTTALDLLLSTEDQIEAGSSIVIAVAVALRVVIELALLVIISMCGSSHLRSNSYEEWSDDGVRRHSADLSSDSTRSRSSGHLPASSLRASSLKSGSLKSGSLRNIKSGSLRNVKSSSLRSKSVNFSKTTKTGEDRKVSSYRERGEEQGGVRSQIDGSGSFRDVALFLAEVRLEHYAGEFHRIGARSPDDLAHISTEDLSEMGMSLLEQRRFEFAMREAVHGRGEDRGDDSSDGAGSLRSDSIKSGGSFVSAGGSFKAPSGGSFVSGGQSFRSGAGGESFRSGGSFRSGSFRSGGSFRAGSLQSAGSFNSDGSFSAQGSFRANTLRSGGDSYRSGGSFKSGSFKVGDPALRSKSILSSGSSAGGASKLTSNSVSRGGRYDDGDLRSNSSWKYRAALESLQQGNSGSNYLRGSVDDTGGRSGQTSSSTFALGSTAKAKAKGGGKLDLRRVLRAKPAATAGSNIRSSSSTRSILNVGGGSSVRSRRSNAVDSGGSVGSQGSFKVSKSAQSSGGSILSRSSRARRNSDSDSFRERETSGTARERDRMDRENRSSRRSRRFSDEMSDASFRENERRKEIAAIEAEALAEAMEQADGGR
eukprot:COSAG02_NODE_462_length_21838_cov_17.900501_3_plen_4662_part_00